MTPLTVVIAAAIIGLIVGSALVPGAPIFGLPIVAVLAVILGFTELHKRRTESRQLQQHREQADDGRAIEFTARDKETLA